MSTDPRDRLTELLRRASAGDREAANQAYAALMDEMRRAARRILGSPTANPSLDADDLIGGAMTKLASGNPISWSNRGHFLAAMSCAMRQYLIDHSRNKGRRKRGGGRRRVPLTGIDLVWEDRNVDLLDLDAAFARLTEEYPETARILELTHFLELTADEAAAATGTSPRTVVRELRFGRAFLRAELDR